MNKSRRMLTELARQLAARGRGLVVPDFLGTGDSDGEFADTDCHSWFDELRTAEQWSTEKGWTVDSLLGIRLGCAVAANYAQQRQSRFQRTVFWQPQLSGARALDQFLRLRLAASLSSSPKSATGADTLAAPELDTVEVAGYELSATLTKQLRALQLPTQLTGELGNVFWFETVRSDSATMPAASANALKQLQATGTTVQVSLIQGEPFWISVETVCNQDLVRQTADRLCSAGSS